MLLPNTIFVGNRLEYFHKVIQLKVFIELSAFG